MPLSAPSSAAPSAASRHAALGFALALSTTACPLLLVAPMLVDDKHGSDATSVRAPTFVVGPSMVWISVGGTNACVFGSSGAASCWGTDSYGELGTGGATPGASATPVSVTGGHTFLAVAAGPTTCGVAADSVAHCWGLNQSGALGIGSTDGDRHATPVAVEGGGRFGTITVGVGFACALGGGGAASCWGEGRNGELGDGTATSHFAPGRVAGGVTFTSLSAGSSHSCGVATSGAAYCWGLGWEGELGVGAPPNVCFGTNACAQAPALVAGGYAWKAITAGQSHSCGITTGGDAYCWGRGVVVGQLGVGRDTSTTTPAPVAGGLKWTAITAGREHTCALASGGAAYCWGTNDSGQLGSGSSVPSSNTPVPVAGGLALVALDAGGDHTCGLTTDGSVYCWGTILR